MKLRQINFGINWRTKILTYIIRAYREEYFDDHVKVEADEKSRWDIIVRPNKDQIKTNLMRIISQPDFDPENFLYAFEEDRIVGVVTSSIYEEGGVIKGDLKIPFVAEGYEDARDIALETFIKAFEKIIQFREQSRFST